jgi:hypothetical protein
MNTRINICLLVIILVLVIIILVKQEREGFRGGGFAMRGGGGGGGMRAFGGASPPMGPRMGPAPMSPRMGPAPMGPPGPPGPPPPGPKPFPPGPFPRPARGYGGVGWASSGIPAYRYFNDYPLAYSYSYANELNLCNNGCCDFEQCRLGNGCKFTSNDIQYMGENPDSCIYHKKCVSANVDKLGINELEKKCAIQSRSNRI